jgi:type I restriction enzyme R subunit
MKPMSTTKHRVCVFATGRRQQRCAAIAGRFAAGKGRQQSSARKTKKRCACKAIIADYNKQYSTSHTLNEFDVYYQDVQQRIKFQKYTNTDYPHINKIDIIIVVDMLLTGFDSTYLNTLYVDKNLKYHGLIQAFSRTNRILNDTKPYGNILDFRQQQDEVDKAIALFSGEDTSRAKEIWLVDAAPKVIEKYERAVLEMAAVYGNQQPGGRAGGSV